MGANLLDGGTGDRGVAIIALSGYREGEGPASRPPIERPVPITDIRGNQSGRLPARLIDRRQPLLHHLESPSSLGHPYRRLRLHQGQGGTGLRLLSGQPILQGGGFHPGGLDLELIRADALKFRLRGQDFPLMVKLAGGQPLLRPLAAGGKILQSRLLGAPVSSGGGQRMPARLEGRPGSFQFGIFGGAIPLLLDRRQDGHPLAIGEGQGTEGVPYLRT